MANQTVKTNKILYGEDTYEIRGRHGGKMSGGFSNKRIGKDGLTGHERSIAANKKRWAKNDILD